MKKLTNFLCVLTLTLVIALSPLTAWATTFDPARDPDFGTEADTGVALNSEAGILVNLDTDTVVFTKNADEAMEPASVTKIIVALLLLENVHDLEKTEITAPNYIFDLLAGTNSSVSGLRRGETLTAEQMLYCLLVPSGNDAALAIADHLGKGSVDAFVALMNQRAKEIGCTRTHFANPHGLHDPNHYTTARDTARIVQYILNSEYADQFMKVCKTTSYTLGPSNVRNTSLTLHSTNGMQISSSKYYYKYTEGVKTGSTGEAGYCLATTAYNASVNYRYLCVTFQAPMKDAEGKALENGAMWDHKALYEWAFSSLEYKQLVFANTGLMSIGLDYAWERDTLLLVPETDFSALVPGQINPNSVVLKPVDVPERINAPVEKGQVIGKAEVTYAGMVLGTVNLVADDTVEVSQLLLIQEQAIEILNSKWLKIGAVVLIVLLILYVVISIAYNVKKKKKKRRNNNLNGRSGRGY